MDSNSIDIKGQATATENVKKAATDNFAQPTIRTMTATKHVNENVKDNSNSQGFATSTKVVYLKKVTNSSFQTTNSTTNSIKEPIPKLIVSTKSIKFGNQYNPLMTSDNVRCITVNHKTASPETNDNTSIQQPDPLKSPKIIIKGITSNNKRLVVCESPTTDPISPQLSPRLHSTLIVPLMESNKNESKTANDKSSLKIDENVKVPEPAPHMRDDNLPTSSSSTPRTNREMIQLQKTVKESKVLTDFVVDAAKRLKRKMNDDAEAIASTPFNTQKNSIGRSRSLSTSNERNESSEVVVAARRNTRSLNAEFSAKQKKFLAGIQKHSRDDTEDEHCSDDEHVRGRKKAKRKSGKTFLPLKVC